MAETSQRFRASYVRKVYIVTGVKILYLKNYLFWCHNPTGITNSSNCKVRGRV